MPGPRRSNAAVATVTLGVVAGMVGLAFASVPLYRLFCQVTGYGGTTQRAATAPDVVSDRVVTVRFDANVGDGLPWQFAPEQRSVKVHLGEDRLAFFVARNTSDVPIAGTAVFNVTPYKAAPYFVKVACFCFDEQTLQPGEEVEMPVSFYVDPALADDRDVTDVKTITLSYTFYPAENQPAPTAAATTGAAATPVKPAG